jgi:single-stranded-DNA-specific exonuclease
LSQQNAQVRWKIAEANTTAAKSLAQELSLSPIVAQLLVNRGLSSIDPARKFLRPSLDDLYDPESLDGVDVAVARISRAIAKGERILIYGDYDVDGMTSAALLHHLFALLSARVSFFLPRRIEEGYGVNADSLRTFKEQGIDLVITADCGIGAWQEAKLAAELGIDLIVTDHHEPEGPLPEAVAVINPKKRGSKYPFRDLAGVGVAFKLAWAVAKSFSGQKKVSPEFREFLLNAVGLVALGTIADVAPLVGENRIFAAHGLSALANTRLPGIRALMTVAGINDSFTSRDVAFRLAPRLNATGRLNEPALGLELLTTESFGRAMEIARQLDEKNRERQAIERTILAAARKRILANKDFHNQRVIVLADDGWHVGVIGIVASRLAEEFYRPTVLMNLEGAVAKGSARSIPPFHIFEALKSCDNILLSYGGHAQAAGMAVEACKVEALREALEAAARQLSEDDFTPTVFLDAEIRLNEVTTSLVKQLDHLAPFGEGNPQPLFAAMNLATAGRLKRVGADGQHLAFFVKSGNAITRAIAFGWGGFAPRLENHRGSISVACEPQLNTYGGAQEVQLVVRDIRLD